MLSKKFCLRSDICSDNDLLIIDIINKTKSFTETIQLINIYNEKSLLKNNNKRTIKKCLHTITSAKYIIICEDIVEKKLSTRTSSSLSMN